MATKREKYMIGGLLVALGVGGVGYGLIWPSFQGIMGKMEQKAQSELVVQAQEAQVTQLTQQIRDLKKLKDLPEGLMVRQFSSDTLQENIKGMVDQIVQLSTENGNELILLEPWAAPPINPPSESTKADAKGDAPPEPPAPQLQTFGYALTVRGDYGNIIGFLGALNSHQELIEVNSVSIENEAGEERSSAPSGPTNPFKPIKLTANMILFLQPQI